MKKRERNKLSKLKTKIENENKKEVNNKNDRKVENYSVMK